MKPDGDFLVGMSAFTIIAVTIIIALTIGCIRGQDQENQLTKICVDSHRSLVHAEVNGSTVQECK